MGKLILTPRWTQNYGVDYKFTGLTHKALPIPDFLKPYEEWVNSLEYGKFNQILVNWYDNGLHYIGKHSDNESQIVKNSPILSISLGATRKFRIRQKNQKGIYGDITMDHGTVIVMGALSNKS